MSNITEQELEKLAEEKYPTEDARKNMFHDNSGQYSRQKAFVEGYKAALQNKVGDINECYFTTNKISTSATICANCGREKFLHTIGQGIKATKTIYQSDVSAEEYINKKQLQFNTYTSEGVITKQGLIKHLEEYASIVNERKDNIPADFKQVTGHNSPKEMISYEKGREDEQEVIMKWIEQWDGSSNSAMSTLLKKKFDERKDNAGVNDAIEFADWLNKNASRNAVGSWGYFGNMFYTKTSKELYDVFKSEL